MIAVAEHRVTTGCISGPQIPELMADGPADVLYTVPPWGEGAMKMADLVNRRDSNGTFTPQISHTELYQHLREIIRTYVRGWVFIETGVQQVDEVEEHMRIAGLRNRQSWIVTYQSGGMIRDCVLLKGPTEDWRELPHFNPMPFRGVQLATYCLDCCNFPGGTVLDPCCGDGSTARAAIATRMTFRGNDLNPKRAQRTGDYLKKAVNHHA